MSLVWARGKGDCSSVVCPPVFCCQPHPCERPCCLPGLAALPLLTRGSRARGPALPCKAPNWESGGRDARWLRGAAGAWTPPAACGRQLLSLPHTLSSSSCCPPPLCLHIHPFLTQCTQPSGWFEGDCGLAGEKLPPRVLCSQPGHHEPLLPVLSECCPPLWGAASFSTMARGVCTSRRCPLRYPPVPVPTPHPPGS